MGRRVAWMAVGAGAVAAAAGCSSTTNSTSPTSLSPQAVSTTAGVKRGSGPVSVLYAGSLVNLMEKQIGPGFHSATGYTFSGVSAGSTALAEQIKGKVRRADVFISASPTVNASLEGPANGNWVSWYATFADSPLVLGYNPSSRFAADIRSKPWYQAVTENGILVGRTDPATDPKGKLTVTAITDAAQQYHDPAVTSLTASSSNVFPEETMVGRLQSGQLDAGFFYSSETTAASLPSVPVTVPGQKLQATYTITIVANAPDQAGAVAFVDYFLGPQGRADLKKDGFSLVRPPAVSGLGAPAGVSAVLSGS